MLRIFDDVVAHLSKKSDYIQIFSELDTRSEGWVKGELCYLFRSLRSRYDLSFDVESNRVDFVLSVGGAKSYVELKAISLSGSRSLPFYFSKRQIGKDFEKLIHIPDGTKWCLVVAYPCSEEHWRKHIAKLRYPKVTCERTNVFPIGSKGQCMVALFKIG